MGDIDYAEVEITFVDMILYLKYGCGNKGDLLDRAEAALGPVWDELIKDFEGDKNDD